MFQLTTGELITLSEIASVSIDRIGNKWVITLINRQAFSITIDDYDEIKHHVDIINIKRALN